MTYATLDEMTKEFGEREVITLTDRNQDGQIDADVVDKGLRLADAEIDSYISVRYGLPLSAVPPVLIGIACDITRYRLTGTDVQCTDEIRDRYKKAIAVLEGIAAGNLFLGLPDNGGGDSGCILQPNAGVQFTTGYPRTFSRNNTRKGAY